MKIAFRASIKIIGINPYVLVSARRAARLCKDWRRPLPVRVRVNGQPEDPWRINLMPVGDGSFYLYLHGKVRKASDTNVGDTVAVELEFDRDYKGGPAQPMPTWFREALEGNRRAMRAWSALTPSRQKEIVRYLSALKTRAAQARNLERAMRALSGDPGRFMGRSWDEKATPASGKPGRSAG